MTGRSLDERVDFELLDEASRKLLGYYIHRAFHAYLESLTTSLHRQYLDGWSEGLTRPTPRGRAAPVDICALDHGALSDLVGVYMYVLACHKNANWHLMHRHDAKRVLYLRGYDFEAAFPAGGGMAMGLSTVDTTGFTLELPALLQRPLFKVLSPKEVDTETMTAERYYGDFNALIQWVNRRPAAVYLNALHWQRGVLELIPRMDHYIVYVSSLTESVLWELDQLHGAQRRDRVTVVFDETAIDKKTSQLALQQAMTGRMGRAIWGKPGGTPTLTVAQARAGLAKVFTVMTPDEFKANIEDVRRRVDASVSELRPGERETWLDFEFYPAVEENDLQRLRDMSQALARRVEADQDGPIDSLPLCVARVQLLIYLSLLLGDHAGAGRALAAYAAVMRSAAEHYAPAGGHAADLPEDQRQEWLATFERHGHYAEYAGPSLMAYGRSHEFASQFAEAGAAWRAAFDATRRSVDNAFGAANGVQDKPR